MFRRVWHEILKSVDVWLISISFVVHALAGYDCMIVAEIAKNMADQNMKCSGTENSNHSLCIKHSMLVRFRHRDCSYCWFNNERYIYAFCLFVWFDLLNSFFSHLNCIIVWPDIYHLKTDDFFWFGVMSLRERTNASRYYSVENIRFYNRSHISRVWDDDSIESLTETLSSSKGRSNREYDSNRQRAHETVLAILFKYRFSIHLFIGWTKNECYRHLGDVRWPLWHNDQNQSFPPINFTIADIADRHDNNQWSQYILDLWSMNTLHILEISLELMIWKRKCIFNWLHEKICWWNDRNETINVSIGWWMRFDC
jgi:hypothetical protein